MRGSAASIAELEPKDKEFILQRIYFGKFGDDLKTSSVLKQFNLRQRNE